MDTPLFIDGQFVNATLLNQAIQQLIGGMSGVGQFLHTPGLINPSAMTVNTIGLQVTIQLPDPFAVLFGNGRVADAHGTADGADTTSYLLNLSTLVPPSGSRTVYVLASFTTIGENLTTVIGPPPGHPDYNPNFAPFQFYQTQRASLAITGSISPPDNLATFELFRVTLNAGQNSIQQNQIITSFQQYAGSVLSSTGVAPGSYVGATITVGRDGRVTSASAVPYGPLGADNLWAGTNTFAKEIVADTGIVATGSDAGGAGGQFRAIAGEYGAMIRNDGSNVYFLQTASGSPSGGFNSYRPFSWNLSNGQVTIAGDGAATRFGGPISGPLQVTDPGSFGLQINGPTGVGANLKFTGNGGTNKFLRVINNAFQIINNAYNAVLLSLDDSGNLSVQGKISAASVGVSGAMSAGGSVSAASVSSNGPISSGSGDITAGGGKLRAAQGAFNSGDVNAATLLADFATNFQGNDQYGWVRFPNGTILQSYKGVTSTGIDPVTFPSPFPHGCSCVFVQERNPSGGWPSFPTIWGAQNPTAAGFTCYSAVWNGQGGWSHGQGNNFRYIALGW